jgi:hypothetical protein
MNFRATMLCELLEGNWRHTERETSERIPRQGREGTMCPDARERRRFLVQNGPLHNAVVNGQLSIARSHNNP